MKFIRKGCRVSCDGVFLTNSEYEDYKRLMCLVSEFRSYRKDYLMTYKRG